MARLERNRDLLQKIRKMSDERFKQFIRTCTDDFAVCLADIVTNILDGNVPIKPKVKHQLTAHKKVLRQVRYASPLRVKRLLRDKGLVSTLINALQI